MQLAFRTGYYFIIDKTNAFSKKMKKTKEEILSDKWKRK